MKEKDTFDPISLEIYWNRLISIVDEAANGLVRTAFSTIVRESNDYATVIMDRDGNSIAENTGGIPSFSCILPKTTKHFLEKHPADTWVPGDTLVTNDPWLATGHLPDYTIVTGIFYKDRLVGFCGSIAHSPDVGGSLWSADCREVFEEGIRIPVSYMLKGGVWNQQLLDVIAANVRVPWQVLGDLQAQVVANEVGARRAVEFLADAGLDDFQSLSAALQERTDRAMRAAIRQIPDGVYRSTLDADGYDEFVTHVECTVTVTGDTMHIDYTGTSPQIGRGINCVLNYTHAYSVYPVKCAFDPYTPRNEGSYKAITVTAPEGSLLNPVHPAAVSARQLVGHLLAGAIYKALAPVVPDKIIAECGGAPTMRALFNGVSGEGNRFSQILFASGGMGAAPHRDGMSTTAFPTNVGAGSVEAFESIAPLVVWQKQFRQDSGGAGMFRGGLGQIVEFEPRTPQPVNVSLLSDRYQHPATGILGGGSGAPSEVFTSTGRRPHPKAKTQIMPGERLTMLYAGGGGYGDPSKRSREAILSDIENGYISADAATQIYELE